MSQNREAPAYQEYAASMMAQIAYRTMRLQERGLFYSMRLECWVNGKLPEKPNLLSKVLGFSEQEIIDCLPAVMRFFVASDGFIFCPELENYRKHLEGIKEKQSRGGKVGSALTNKKRYPSKSRMDTGVTSTPPSDSSSTLKLSRQLPRRGQVESLVKSSTVKLSQDQSPVKEPIHDQWLDDYNADEEAMNSFDPKNLSYP